MSGAFANVCQLIMGHIYIFCLDLICAVIIIVKGY